MEIQDDLMYFYNKICRQFHEIVGPGSVANTSWSAYPFLTKSSKTLAHYRIILSTFSILSSVKLSPNDKKAKKKYDLRAVPPLSKMENKKKTYRPWHT
jgi:hypothetical protein